MPAQGLAGPTHRPATARWRLVLSALCLLALAGCVGVLSPSAFDLSVSGRQRAATIAHRLALPAGSEPAPPARSAPAAPRPAGGQPRPGLPACRGPDVAGEVSTLRDARVWRSTKPLPPQSVTIVTQLSLNRLAMLRAQCGAWRDRISAAVYLPSVAGFGVFNAENSTINGTSPAQVASLLGAWHAAAEADAGGCALDLVLAAEDFATWHEFDPTLYPVNALRNRALQLARTQVVLMLDADFLPAASLPSSYQGLPAAWEALTAPLLGPQRVVLVLPAFETRAKWRDGQAAALRAALRGKAHVAGRFLDGALPGFHLASYRHGHGATRYKQWVAATRPYPIRFASGFEPYILIARALVPWFDERFRGHESDKVMHRRHLNATGVAFQVHPDAYVVHMHHKRSPTQRNRALRKRMLALGKEVAAQVRAGTYVPVTTFLC